MAWFGSPCEGLCSPGPVCPSSVSLLLILSLSARKLPLPPFLPHLCVPRACHRAPNWVPGVPSAAHP